MLNDDFNNICEQILNLVVESTIEQEDREKYYNNEKSISECMSFSNLEYYNKIEKQKLYNYKIKAALLQISGNEKVLVSDNLNKDFFAVLSTNEFADNNGESTYLKDEESFLTYEIKKGDTLKKISLSFFGTLENWLEISEANNISENDLLEKNLSGVIIKIPVTQIQGLKRRDENLIYKPDYDINDKETIAQYFYGSDIYIENKTFQVNSKGDLEIVKGVNCVVNNITSILNLNYLNDLHPEFTGPSLDGNVDAPFIITLNRFIEALENKISLDPRVLDVRIDRNTINLKGDTLRVNLDIELVGGNNEFIKGEVSTNVQ